MPFEAHYIIRVSCPMQGVDGFPEKISYEFLKENSLSLRKIIKVLQEENGLGKVGNYKAVFEAVIGFEAFTPLEGSNPTFGRHNQDSALPAVYLTTYAPASTPEQDIYSFVEKVAEVHEWEHPVIEINFPDGRCMTWMPA